MNNQALKHQEVLHDYTGYENEMIYDNANTSLYLFHCNDIVNQNVGLQRILKLSASVSRV